MNQFREGVRCIDSEDSVIEFGDLMPPMESSHPIVLFCKFSTSWVDDATGSTFSPPNPSPSSLEARLISSTEMVGAGRFEAGVESMTSARAELGPAAKADDGSTPAASLAFCAVLASGSKVCDCSR